MRASGSRVSSSNQSRSFDGRMDKCQATTLTKTPPTKTQTRTTDLRRRPRMRNNAAG